MKLKERIKTLTIPTLLNYRIDIIVTNDLVKTRDKILKYNDVPTPSNADFGAMHIFIKKSKLADSYLLFPEKSDVNTISHECWHCIRHLFYDWTGAELDHEMVAYHLAYLVQEVYNFVVKKRKI